MKLKRPFAYILLSLMLLALSIPGMTITSRAFVSIAPIEIQGVNLPLELNRLVVYTEEFESKSTKTEEKTVEAIVDESGKVTAIVDNNSEIPTGGFVLSGSGTKRSFIHNNIEVGDYLHLDKSNNTITIVPKDYNPFSSATLYYTGTNSVRAENTFIVYNGADSKTTSGTNEWGFEAAVDKEGFIISVGGNNTPIPQGGFVLSAIGDKKAGLIAMAELGKSVTLNPQDKSVEFSISKEGVQKAAQIKLSTAKSTLAAQKSKYKNLDFDSLDREIAKAEELIKDLANALQKDDMLGMTVAQNKLTTLQLIIDGMLIENPAVEGRALWIRPTQKNETAVKEVIREIYDWGFNIVCVEGLYNNTTIFPTSSDSLFSHSPAFGGFDVLKAYIDECHRYGMELHLWMPVYRVGHDGSTYPELGLGNKKKEWRNISNTGINYVTNVFGNGHYLNPALPEVTEFLLGEYEYILKNYSIDAFQLDYIRYPDRVGGVDYGYDEYTRNLFEEETGQDPIDFKPGNPMWSQWCQFRADFVTEFVVKVKDMAATLRPDIHISCDVGPSLDESNTRMMQDTVKWLTEGYVDIIHPMAYGTTDRVNTWSREAVKYAGDKIFTYIGVGDYGSKDFFEQLIAIRANNADGVAFFAYNEFTKPEYKDIPAMVFSTKAKSPSYNAKDAAVAQLKFIKDRIEKVIIPSGAKGAGELEELIPTINQLIEDLKDKSLSDKGSDLIKFVKDTTLLLEKDIEDTELYTTLTSDIRVLNKTILLSRDVQKAEYYKDHPLPPLYDIAKDWEDIEQSEDTQDQDHIELNTFEKIARVVSIVIISFSVLALPLYFYLDSRKKRIIAESKEDKENIEEDIEDTEDAEDTEE